MKPPVFILFVLLFWGCETIVQVDLPDYQPQLVINGIFIANTTWNIGISQSVGILGTAQPQPVTNARVEIWQDGQRLTTLTHNSDGFYHSNNVLPRPGPTYELRVSAPGFQHVTAWGSLPPRATVQNVSFVTENIDFFYKNANITVTMDDPPAKNYYEIFVLVRDDFSTWSYTTMRSSDPAFTESNTNIEIGEEREYFGNLALIDDAIFNGTLYPLKFKAFIWEGANEVSVVISALSEEVFLHNQTFRLQDDTNDNPFAEPVQAYSNIQNGYGVFGGVYPDSYFFPVTP